MPDVNSYPQTQEEACNKVRDDIQRALHIWKEASCHHAFWFFKSVTGQPDAKLLDCKFSVASRGPETKIKFFDIKVVDERGDEKIYGFEMDEKDYYGEGGE